MDSILKLVPYGENLPGDVIEITQVVRLLEGLEKSLQREALRWSDVSLLILADAKSASAGNVKHDSTDNIKAGIEQFCAERDWYPSLIGSSVFGAVYAHREETQPEISDGLLFIACSSAVVDRIPVAFEVTHDDPERRFARQRALEKGVRLFRHRLQDLLGVDIPPLTVTESSVGLIFTTGSGHIESKEFIDFKDCYAVGQELVKAAAECSAQPYGGCASNAKPNQLQCLYYSMDIGPRTHYKPGSTEWLGNATWVWLRDGLTGCVGRRGVVM